MAETHSKQISTFRSDLETLKNVRNNNNVKIPKSRKLFTKKDFHHQKRSCFYKDNNLFKNNPKQFYRNNGKSQIKKNKAPSEEEIRSFWEKIWFDSKTLKLHGLKNLAKNMRC